MTDQNLNLKTHFYREGAQSNTRTGLLDEDSILVLKGVILPGRAQGPIGINVDSYKDYGGYVYRCQGDR